MRSIRRVAFLAATVFDLTGILALSLPKMGTSSQMNPSSLAKAKSLISQAISIGAPAYNAGNIDECARVYRATSLEIIPLLPDNLRSSLESTLENNEKDDDAGAWAFRRQFDAIVEYQPPFTPTSLDDDGNNFKLEKFTKEKLKTEPFNVHDGVMGGISQGRWLPQNNTFFGTTSLANNGGFASLRWRFPSPQNWSDAKGIYLKVKHSNPQKHTFNFLMKDVICEQVRLSNYKNTFASPNQEDGPIFLPFDAFDQMEQMGRALQGSPCLNPALITEVGLMAIKPSVVGDFELAIEEWGLYY